MQKYIALTIGPIYKTLKNAKKTREIWGGSYIFSYIMKHLIEEFKDREFIVPYIGNKNIFKSCNEVGLFHDRFIFKSKDGDLEKLKNRVSEVIHFFAKDNNIDEEFLKGYLQISYVEKELEEHENPILELSPYLDTKELFFKTFQYEKNELQHFLKNRLNGSFLVKDAFCKNRASFPSLPEIALSGFDKKEIIAKLKDDELEIYEDRDIKKQLKPYHKYIAIVQADGDNMGKVVEQLKEQKDFNDFSKKLFEFCQESHTKITTFGGQTIFAGGDDLLFFAPIVNDNTTIFSLCRDLSDIFDSKFKDYKTTPKPSLSFGVSITYYKYPLYKTRENAVNLLFNKAKVGEKNAIAYKVTKHSGQSFETVVYKSNSELFEKFLQIIQLDSKMDENFLHSIYTKIYQYKTILENILTNENNENNENKLKHFFKNYFNESEHKKYEDFFQDLVEFFVLVDSDKSITNKIDFIYASLRFKKFLLGDKNG